MDLKIILLGQSNLDFVIKKIVLVYLFQFEKFVKGVKMIIKKTYLAFLDLKKAYDSVPIGNIL